MAGRELEMLWREHGAEIALFAQHMHAVLSGYAWRRLDGVAPLSPREIDCVSFIAAGLRPDRIAQRLGLAAVTVNLHVRNARRKLSAKTNAETVAKAIRYGLIKI